MTTREAFEDWYEVDCYPCEHSNWFRLDSDGDYEFDEVQYAWRTWQAATAAALERAAEVCVSLRDETVMSKYASIGNCTAARDSAQRCYEAICALKDRP